MEEDETTTAEPGKEHVDASGRWIALAVYLLLPAAVLVTAPATCGLAGGGARCWSLAGLTAIAYPLWLLYSLPTGIAAWGRLAEWRAVAVVNVLAGWTVIGWFNALRRATASAKGRQSEGGEPSQPVAGGWTPQSWSPPPPGYPLLVEGLAVAEPERPAYGAGLPAAPDIEPARQTAAWATLSRAPAWVRAGDWPAGSLVIKLCDGFEVYSEGQRITETLRSKQAVCFLWLSLFLRHLLTPGSTPRREDFADEMSPGLDGRSQRRQLSNRLHDLGGLHPALRRAVRADNQTVSFDGELAAREGTLVADLMLLHDLAEHGRRDTRYEASEVADIERLLEGCKGEVLPEWDGLDERITRRRGTGGDLIAAIRGRHAEDLASVSLALAQTHLEAGSAGRAADLLRMVLELKPDREDVARRLVAALTAAGRISEADRTREEYLG